MKHSPRSLLIATCLAVTPVLQATYLMDDFDDTTGFFNQFNPNAVYTAADSDSSGENELQVDVAGGGFAYILRHFMRTEERNTDPFLNALVDNPVFVFSYENLSQTDGVTVLLTIQFEPGDAWVNVGALSIGPGGKGTYVYDLGNDPDMAASVADWLAGSGTAFGIRIVQQTLAGTPSSVRYDDIRLEPASFLGDDFLLLENFDDLTGYFQQYNPNATYTVEDTNGDGDNELKIEFANSGYNMNLRHGLPRTDPLFGQIEENPAFYFDVENLSTTDPVTVAVLFANGGLSESWPALGSLIVEPGESVQFAHNLKEDPFYQDLSSRFLAGEGEWVQIRLVQLTDSGIPSSIAIDNIGLGPAPVEAPALDVVMDDWNRDGNIGWVYGLADGWAYHREAGFLYYSEFPWVYLAAYGWVGFGTRASDTEIFFHSPVDGWLMVSELRKGEVYVLEAGTWIRL